MIQEVFLHQYTLITSKFESPVILLNIFKAKFNLETNL